MVPHKLYSQNVDISWNFEANNHNRPFLSIIEMKKSGTTQLVLNQNILQSRTNSSFISDLCNETGVDSILGNLQICYWKVEAYDFGGLQIPDNSGSSAFTSAPRQTRRQDKVMLCFDTSTRSTANLQGVHASWAHIYL